MTLYPDGIDSSLTIPPVAGTTPEIIAINEIREATIAVETELGINPAGVYSDVATRLSIVESRVGPGPGNGEGLVDVSIQPIGILHTANGGTGLGTVGDADMVLTSTGSVLQYKYLDNSNIDGYAAIDITKLAPGSVSQFLRTNAGATNTEWANLTFTDVNTTLASANSSININGQEITGSVLIPASDSSLASKHYVDNFAQGLSVKQAVVAIATTSITLSGAQTIDGYAAVAGNRVLVAGQGGNVSTPSINNGIYIVAAGAWSRATDLDTGASAAHTFVFIEDGTDFISTGWTCTNAVGADTVGTNTLAFAQLSAAGQIVAGDGLVKIGDVISSVNADGTIIASTGDIKVGIIDNSNISNSANIAASKLATGSNRQVLTTVSSIPVWSTTAPIFTVGPTGSNTPYETDGTADDVQINAAISDAYSAGGGTVLLLAGTYSLATPVNLMSNVTLQGVGSALTNLVVANTFDYNTYKWAVGCAGVDTTGTAIPLTVDATIGSQSLTATAGAELSAISANDYVFLRSEALWEGASGVTTKIGEFVKIMSVSGTTVNIWGITRSDYLVSDTASLYRISLVSDVAILDLSITQQTTQGTATTSQASVPPFISLQRTIRGRISGCRLYNGDCPAITIFHCLDVDVENNHIDHLTNDTTNKRLGYGCLIGGGTERCIVNNNTFSNLRHGVDAGTSLSPSSITNSYSVARGVIVTNNVVEHATSACYSTHAGGEGWEFIGNSAINSLCYGFFMRARGSRIISNTISTCGGGIGIGETSFSSSAGSGAGSHVIGNTLRNIKTQSITAELIAAGVLSSTYAGGEGIILGLTDNVIVANNSISECDGAAIRLRLSAIRNQIVNNTIIDANMNGASNVPGILIDGNYNGSVASIAFSAGTITLTGMTAQTSTSIGRIITIFGAASSGNNGSFTILTVPGSTSVTFANVSGVDADANNGAIHYWIEGSTDNIFANNTVINRAASDYDPNAIGGQAKYAIRDSGTLGNIRNVYKNNTGINMITGLMSVNTTSAFSAGNATTEAITVKTKAGAITDSDFLVTPDNGTYAVDTTNYYGYLRAGSWLQIPTSGASSWQWDTGTSSPTITQADKTTNSSSGATLTIQAQNETGTASTGGALNLSSGTGTTAAGNVVIQTGGVTRLTVLPASTRFADTATALTITPVSAGTTSISFASTVTSASISQSSTSITNGTTLQLTAQGATGDGYNGGNLGLAAGNATGTTGTGGSVNIQSGTGNTNNGTINLRAGSTTAYAITVIPAGACQISTASTATSVKLLQATLSSGTGATYTVQAQNVTTGAGGALALTSGTGSTEYGQVKLLGATNIGIFTQAMADADQVVSAANSAKNIIITTGSNSTVRALTISVTPTAGLFKLIRNNCTTSGITVKWLTGAATATIPVNSSVIVGSDGTDCIILMSGT